MRGFTKCGNACVDLDSDEQNCGGCNTQCSGGKMCTSGRCTCPSGTHDCGGRCEPNDSTTACGASCQLCRSGVARATDVCENGRCGFRCNAGTAECRGQCVSVLTDRNNCGSCGNVCNAEESCTAGLCTCPLGEHNCGGACVSSSSVDTCGLRCTPCPAGANETATCDGLFCGVKCSTGVLCGGRCLNVDNDPENCGACFLSCLDQASPGPNCVFGQCTP